MYIHRFDIYHDQQYKNAYISDNAYTWYSVFDNMQE